MNLGMVKRPPKVVLDTNILISALVYGGKPEQVYNLALEKQITAVTSGSLTAELEEILIKKFSFEQKRIGQLSRIIKKHFLVVYPKTAINVIKDEPDNRVLEAAMEGNCDYIVTGDKDLLSLKRYKNVLILKPDDFLANIQN